MLVLQHQILKAQKSLNHDEYCYHIKVYSDISKLVLYSCIILSIGNFHTVLSVFVFFLLIALESRSCPFKGFILVS